MFLPGRVQSQLGTDAIKATLRKGLRQCEAGGAHLGTVNFTPAAKFCVLTVFQLDSAAEDSRIKFADPEDLPSAPEWAHRRISTAYYKSALQAKGWIGTEADPFDQNIYTPQRVIEGIGSRTFSLVGETEVPAWLEELPLPIQQQGMAYSLYLDDQILGALRQGDGRRYKEEITDFKTAVNEVNGGADVVRQPKQPSIVQVFGDGLVMVLSNAA